MELRLQVRSQMEFGNEEKLRKPLRRPAHPCDDAFAAEHFEHVVEAGADGATADLEDVEKLDALASPD